MEGGRERGGRWGEGGERGEREIEMKGEGRERESSKNHNEDK